MKALGLVVSNKKIFENCILKTYFLTPWPIYATNWNGLNNFDRGQPRNYSCEVWSKSNKRFQRRCCLKKLLTDGRTHARTMDDGQWDITKAPLEHFVLRWAKKNLIKMTFMFEELWTCVEFLLNCSTSFYYKFFLWIEAIKQAKDYQLYFLYIIILCVY